MTVGGENVRTDGGLTLAADYALEDICPQDYSLLLLPGLSGEIPETLIENNALKRFVQSFTGLIAASCASALLIAGAGRLTGKFTMMPWVKEQYEPYFSQGTYVDQDVCVDQQVITSKGFAHIEFMLKVLEELGLFKEDPRLEKMALHLSKNSQ